MKKYHFSLVACFLLLAPVLLFAQQPQQNPSPDETTKWREAYETRLKSDTGWLTVSGLFWLHPGENALGSGAESTIQLPAEAGPAQVGNLRLEGKKVTLLPKEGVSLKVNGKAAAEMELHADITGKPDVLTLGSLTFFVIERGERVGVRLKDLNSKARREFKGLHWYPVQPNFRLEAKFVPYNPPKTVPITNVLGDVSDEKVAGYVEFKIKGKTCRLDALEEDGGLFLIFRDLTAGKGTYPAGRFLNTEAPKDGKVWLDFNRAHNPPCAYTEFATCPLPPEQNRLKVAIPAGEKSTH